MGLKTKKILDIDIISSSKKEVLEEMRKYLGKVKSQKSKVKNKEIKPLVIFTPNPEIINFAQKNPYFRQIVNSAQINIPDGWGIVWAVKKLYRETIGKINGVDFMLEFCQLAENKGVRVGLIGGRGGVALKSGECLREKYPGLEVEALEAPEIKITNYKLQITNKNQISKSKKAIKTPREWQAEAKAEAMTLPRWRNQVEGLEKRYFISLINEIKMKKIDILFVALGFPKQEYFIDSVKRKALSGKINRPLVLMAVGGAFDYISGRVKRAPIWLREGGLEWLYRLIREPWRLGRQIKGAEFFWRVLLEVKPSVSS